MININQHNGENDMKRIKVKTYETYTDYVIAEIKSMVAENKKIIEKNNIILNNKHQ